MITVPASFNTDQRTDTIIATRMAGFKNVRLMDEPTAAFYYYFDINRDSGDFTNINNILIFDFGGGTLDVSIIRAEDQGSSMYIDVIGRSRYNNLGGDDIDMELAVFMLACWELESGRDLQQIEPVLKKALFRKFIEKCRLYKEEVEDYIRNELPVPEFSLVGEDIYGSNETLKVDFSRQLTRSQYDDLTGKFLQSKSDLNIYRPIEEAFSLAGSIRPGFSVEDLDLILYTGGASNMVSVQSALGAYFSPKTSASISPEEACDTVALGAACYQYDRVYGEKHMEIPHRLLESLFTRKQGESTYTTLVPLTCEPSLNFHRVDETFELKRPTIKLKFPVFMGVSPHDHQLSPMRSIEFRLERVVPKQTPYQVFYRMTEDKTSELKLTFNMEKPFDVFATIDPFAQERLHGASLPLCKVNAVEGSNVTVS